MKSLLSNSARFVKTARRCDSIHPRPTDYAIMMAFLLVSAGAFMPDFVTELRDMIAHFSKALVATSF